MRRRPGRLSHRVGVVSVVVIALALLGCGGPSVTSPSPPGSTGSPGTPRPSVAPPSVAPPSVAPPSAVPSASTAGVPIAVDALLLSLLPGSIAGIPVTEDRDTAAEIATDPSLAATIAALDVATAFGPLASDGIAGDYAIATVALLRPDVYSDALFRSWRDSFESGVCASAGGVDPGRSEFELGGRTVYRSTCAGGVVIYQTYLDGPGALVSIQGGGPADLGRAIAGSLKE